MSSQKAAFIKFQPAATAEYLEDFLNAHGDDLKAVVLAGYGKGNGPDRLVPVIEKFIEKGVAFFMTTSCSHGAVDMSRYEAGDQFRRVGVIGLGEIKPEDAYNKVCAAVAVCGTRQEIENYMRSEVSSFSLAPNAVSSKRVESPRIWVPH